MLKNSSLQTNIWKLKMRLSIEITPEQHKNLKAAAALQGKSIKSYVLEKALPAPAEQEALQQLEAHLTPRATAAKEGKLSGKSVDDIFDEEIAKAK